MEELLRKIQRDAAGHKHKSLRDACAHARESLQSRKVAAGAAAAGLLSPSELRARCLLPLQVALESKNLTLAQMALSGMQTLLCEDGLAGGAGEEAEPAERRPLSQVLAALRAAPELHEDLQVEVMKVLLCLTYSPSFDANADSVLRVTQVCAEMYARGCHRRSVDTAVRATLGQILGDLTLQLRRRQEGADGEEPTAPPLEKRDLSPVSRALCHEVVTVLTLFCDKLESLERDEQMLRLLYLESVLAVLSSCPPSVHLSGRFTDLVWKRLCPALAAAAGEPPEDKSAPGEWERLRPGAKETWPPSGGTAARAVCYAAAELVRLVGRLESMKPVLQSLYHRILIYPPPRRRAEAIRVMKEMLACPQRLLELAAPGPCPSGGQGPPGEKKWAHPDLLGLILDGTAEACGQGGAEARYWSVSAACALLGALEELSRGRGLTSEQAALLEAAEPGAPPEGAGRSESDEGDFPWRRRGPSSTEVGHTLTPVALESGSSTHRIGPAADGEALARRSIAPVRVHDLISKSCLFAAAAATKWRDPDGPPRDVADDWDWESAGPEGEEPWSRRERRAAPPDVVQRGRASPYPDVTGFLSLPSRSGGAGASRYSESNFSTEERDPSRTDLDSCDRYSAAAEKDSGASDVSDVGSEREDGGGEPGSPAGRRGARLLARALAALLPRLLASEGGAQADRQLLDFAHAFCSGPGEAPLGPELPADAVYLLTFSALLLNLKLRHCDFYRRGVLPPALGPEEFARGIRDVGASVSPAWTEELHRQLVERDLLGQAGYREATAPPPPLVAMLMDTDAPGGGGARAGANSRQSSGSDDDDVTVAAVAGAAFSRFLLTSLWGQLTEVLSAPLTAPATGGGGRSSPSHRERDAVYLSLDGLRRAAALSRDLGVAGNCASALARMAAASCAREEPDARGKRRPERTSAPAGVRLHAAHVLCMEAVLDVGSEMGAHHHQCWTHVFRVTEYISSLEHAHFGEGEPRAEGRAPEPAPTVRQRPHAGSLLSGPAAARAACALSARADRLLEEAALRRNLPSLLGFLQQLRKASRRQLFGSAGDGEERGPGAPGMPRQARAPGAPLRAKTSGGAGWTSGHPHLFRLGEATLRIVRDGDRPLLHKMRAWSVVAPHLVEAACHGERQVSRKAVSLIHDVLTEVLNGPGEPPGFRYNQALFRPLEHIMRLEVCDEDVQDQVVTSIGQLVEACSPAIRSGWPPLFSALGNVRGGAKEYAADGRRPPVFDVFEAFVATDDVQVFANAAADYVACLVKFVKGWGEPDGEAQVEEEEEEDREEKEEAGDDDGGSLDLCLPALDYLRRCSQMLARIYQMPSKPVFLGAGLAGRRGEDAAAPDFDDDGTGLIQVWSLLLERLAAAASDCPRRHQPPALETLFGLLRETAVVPGPLFAIWALARLLLPVVSLWLRRVGDGAGRRDGAADFKHAIGLCCELAVEHVRSFADGDEGCDFWIHAMLKELFRLLVACVSQASETLSRAGCSCIRYVLVTAGPVFSQEMWSLACHALREAFSVTLRPVKALLASFQSGTDRMCGDACQVKMVAPSPWPRAEAECLRIRTLARQVFVSDGQVCPESPEHEDAFEQAQSCVLIVEAVPDPRARTPPYDGIPFREVVVSLLSHQVLLRNLEDILLEEEAEPERPEGRRPEAAGFLPHLSAANLSVVLDLPLDSYRTARDFDARPALKYLLMKVSGLGGAANLYRQATAGLRLYSRLLLRALAARADGLTGQQVVAAVSEEREPDWSSDSSRPGSPSSEDEDIFEETAQVSPPRSRRRHHRWRAASSPSAGPACEWTRLLGRLRRLSGEVCGAEPEDPAVPREASAPAEASLGGSGRPGPVQRGARPPRCAEGRRGRHVDEDDARARAQAWSAAAAALLTEVLRLPDAAFVALQPALYTDLCRLACRAGEAPLRRALGDWLARVGRLYRIVA
ncbi:brefeldin A-inhibited guanine nucleotide-exchange protein 3 [Stigmatopora nigra]